MCCRHTGGDTVKQPGHESQGTPSNNPASTGEGFIMVNKIPKVAHQTSSAQIYFLLPCCCCVQLTPGKTFATCSVGLPPSTGYLPWRQGMHLVLLSPCPPPRWCMVLGVFQSYPSTGHTCAHAHESINTQIFMCWC